MATAHSRIGASSYYRWKACPGSVRLSAGIESKSSKYAEEGTEAHELAALILEGKSVPPSDPEMFDSVMVYVNAVRTAVLSSPGTKLLVEHSFDLSEIHPGAFGTCDAVVFDEKEKTLRVFDYKHGAGIPVEVVEDGKPNSQLAYYGLGALLSTKFPCEWVELIIVQPRCAHPNGPVRRHKFESFDLLDFAADLKKDAEATEDPFSLVVPGDHCRFCPAVAVCPALEKKAQDAAKLEFGKIEGGFTDGETQIIPGKVAAYEPAKLARVLHSLPMVEAWAKGVREFAYNELNAGKNIPGWKLVAKRATRKWKDEAEAAAAFEKELTPTTVRSLFDPPSLKSVAQVEKVLHKNQLEKFGHLISQESSGNTLVPEYDPRPAVVVLDAKTEFEVLDLLS